MKSKIFKIAVSTSDVEAFVAECRAIDWVAYDTGERVMTDEGPDGEAILLVEPSARASQESREAILHSR